MYTFILIAAIVGLFVGLIFLFEIGRHIGLNRLSRDPDGAHSGVGAVESAVFGLMGLLIGFTFFGAAQRFDYRRNLVVEETNRIATAYSRLDLLPKERQPAVRQLLRDYLDTRIGFYRDLTNESAVNEQVKMKELQTQICRRLSVPHGLPTPIPMQACCSQL